MVTLTYSGQEVDKDLGVMNYNARLYDPGLSRFLSVDPLRQFHSPYNYVGNNPFSFIDPSGMGSEAPPISLQPIEVEEIQGTGSYIAPYTYWNCDYFASYAPSNQARVGGGTAYYHNNKYYGYYVTIESEVTIERPDLSPVVFPERQRLFVPVDDPNYSVWLERGSNHEHIYGNGYTIEEGENLDWDDLFLTAPGTLASTKGNLKQNKYSWVGKNGKRYSTKSLEKVGLYKYRHGVNGLRNSFDLARNASAGLKMAGNYLGAAGVVVTIYDMRENGVKISNTTDLIMTGVGFIPGVGWAIGGAYFATSFVTELTTGHSLSEHLMFAVEGK